MRLDLTITLGNIITIACMLGGVFVAYEKLRERLIAIEVQLAPLWDEFTERRRASRRLADQS